jgi:hypothetical protein
MRNMLLNAAPPAHDSDSLVALLQYANAHAWYKNLDKLIHYANADGRLNVFYSRSAWLTAPNRCHDCRAM